MWVVHGKKKTVLIIVTGGQEWLRWCAMTAVIPGSGASSNGLKHALVPTGHFEEFQECLATFFGAEEGRQ